jgi:hypothetical protein
LDNYSSLEDISKFYFTNKLLPEAARYAISPQSRFSDTFIDITEEGLAQAFGPSDDIKTYLKSVSVFQVQKSLVKNSARLL